MDSRFGFVLKSSQIGRRGLSGRERLAVYTGGYVLRLLECMRADFPVLRGFVGDSVFDAFAKAYLITMPPGSHSLYDLGADFPRFLNSINETPNLILRCLFNACREQKVVPWV